MTDPKHEGLVFAGIASNFQTPFEFLADFHFKYLGVRSQILGTVCFQSQFCVEISFQD